MQSKLLLPEVTLIAVTSKDIPSHKEAIEKSTEAVYFGDVRLIEEPTLTSIDAWNKYIIFDLWKHVDTEFAMLIHADGYVKNPSAWRNDFLEYDYIGAPWPLPRDNYSYRDQNGEIVRVGNSVSIRSQKMLRAPTTQNFEWKSFYGNTNEDGFLCCHHRQDLEALGCTFAPLEVAKYFSKEHEIPENEGIDTFAFHQTDI
jgi:hypothetical protein